MIGTHTTGRISGVEIQARSFEGLRITANGRFEGGRGADVIAVLGQLLPNPIEPQQWHESSEQKLAEQSYCEGWNACRVATVEAMRGLDQHLTSEHIDAAVAAWFETASAGSFEKRMRAAVNAVFIADAGNAGDKGPRSGPA